MCGIAGIVTINPNELSLERLKAMTDSIGHRGPDGEGQWISADQRVGLGHRRLSIIDLSEHAKQPMHYLGRYTITFNGEIYNYLELKEDLIKQGYQFESNSDTEVLMALYHRDKEQCLNVLDGMFAFAIYDNQNFTLFCARDRFGEKPFHFHYVPGKQFVFGSEMKELWSIGISKSVSDVMLFNYLKSGFLHNPTNLSETFYSEIKRLEHGHYLMVDTRNLTLINRQYWSIDLFKTNEIDFKSAAAQFKELFYTSVKRRLRSDVPVGSSLSGGLDSSAVVCAIDSLNQNNRFHQKTFSAQFPGYKKNEAYFQELVIAKTNADAYITYPNGEAMLEQIDKVYWHQEEPFGSASIMAQYEVFKLAKNKQVTVLLDGQGADEYLAGYHPYFMYFFLELEKNKAIAKSEFSAYQSLHGDNTINGVYNRNLKYHLRNKLPFAFDLMRNIKGKFFTQRGSFSTDFFNEFKDKSFLFDSNYTNLNSVLHSSLIKGPMQDLLRYADRNSMAHSREVRLPFLFHELVEFVFSLPASYKMHNGWTKYIMREAFSDILPNEITWRVDKIGYEPPQQEWMKQQEVQARILESKGSLVEHHILDKKVLDEEIKGVEASAKGINDWSCWMGGKLFE